MPPAARMGLAGGRVCEAGWFAARGMRFGRRTSRLGGEANEDAYGLDVEEAHVAGVALDEPTARLDVLPHEDREDLVRGRGAGEGHLEERRGVGGHRGRTGV